MTRHARTRGARPSPSGLGAAPRRGRPARERLLGLLSLLTLMSLVTGVPAALIALRGNPLPHSGLDQTALIDALTRPDDGSLFLGALTWLAWAGWATFAFSVLVEVPAHVRGLPSPRLPALGLPQRAASSLVAGAALLFTLPSFALSAPAMVARPAAAVSVQHPSLQPAVTGAGVATSSSSQTARTTLPSYTVMPGDSLWHIAEERLGDGGRYHEIAKLNYGVVQTDGRALTSDHWIRPGWTMTLPQDARPTDQHHAEDHTVVVQPGDTLWQIARDTLGDGARYEEIAAASPGLQPDGAHLTDPDLIRPGWKVIIPEAHAAASQTPVRGQPAPSATPKKNEPQSRIDEPAAPAQQVPDEVSPQPSEQHRSPLKQAPTAHQADNHGTGADEGPVSVRTAGGVGALLAAGLLVLLARRRARQQRRRSPGQRIAMPPPDLASVELELRLAEDPSGLHRVDQALRTLSLRLGERSQTLPPLRSARLTAQEFRLTLAEPEALPAPFASTADPRVWVLPASTPLPSATRLAAVPAPYPSLVTVGQDQDGAQILVDLEYTGALAVIGEPDDQVAVLAALAAELATSPWADDLQITLVGCLEQLPAALGTGRVTHVDDVEKLLPVLENRASAVRAALQSLGLPHLRQARTASPDALVAGASWTPSIVLLAGPIPPALRSRLRALLQDRPEAGTAVVTAGDSELSEWQLTFNAANASTSVLKPLNLELQPQTLTTPDLDQLLSLLAVADQPSHETPDASDTAKVLDELRLAELGGQLVSATTAAQPEGQRPAQLDDVTVAPLAAQPVVSVDVAESDERSDDDATSPADVPMIQVLGPVEILNARGPVEPSKTRQLTEIAAFMALHPGSDHHGLSEAIWPGARAVDNTRNTAVSKLRKWLGTTEDGTDYVPWVLDDGYRLHPRVRSDWQLWRDLIPTGPAAASDADLATALELVKGRPFAGTNPRRYAWADRERQDMISAIVDASHELASRALLSGDAMLARRAAAAGLQVDPGIELLWRDALKADWLAGDREGLMTTADRLSALIEELGDDLEPETIELMDDLLRRRSRQVGVR